MSRSMKTTAKLSAAALALALLAGCATTQDGLDPNSVATAQERADAAMAAAQEAKAEDEAARAEAAEAKSLAEDAQGQAKAAQFAADRNAEKLERMFQKSMYK